MKLIKRYENRKLYDVDNKTYIKLNEIARIIRDGSEVRIIDHASGEDLTAATLAQILFEQERQGLSNLPSEILTKMIELGDHKINQIRRGLFTLVEPMYLEKEILHRLTILVQENRITPDEYDQFADLLTETRNWQKADLIPEKAASSSDLIQVQEKINQLETDLEEIRAILKNKS